MNKQVKIKWLAAAVALMGAGAANAFTFESESGAVRGSFDSTISFGVGVRAQGASCDSKVGTFFGGASAPTGTSAGCLDGAYGANDQGNLNYKQGQTFTQYLKGSHELLLKLPDDYKFMARVNWVRDFASTHTSGYISGIQNAAAGMGGSTASLTPDARRELEFKARVLDLWVSKEFDLNGERARIRVGNQVISWGESLFLPGGINQTNAMDIMRLSQPGTQLKEVMLPAPIASFATGLGNGFNIEGYVQSNWNRNYMPPVGSYWSVAMVGNGAGSFTGGVPGFAVPTGKTPRNSGQYGLALRYQPTGTQANFGFYTMRYHDKNPVMLSANNGTGAVEWSYLEDRTLYGASVNFPLGNWAIGAEASYRPKDPITLNPLNPATGLATCPNGKCYAEEKKYQFHLTGLLSLTPGDHGPILNFLGADTATLLAEAVMVRYPDLKSTYGGSPVASALWTWGGLTAAEIGASMGSGAMPSVGDKNSWGYNLDFSWTYDGTLIPGWQVTPEVYYFHAVKGRTPNLMGQFMEGAKSANFIVTFTQNPANWAVGLNYAKFWGGDSVFDQPYRSRDFYGAYISRNF